MKTITFWTLVIIVILITFGGIAVINNGPDKPGESKEGYIVFEPIEIIVPVTVLDFTDEPPMLITPDMVD